MRVRRVKKLRILGAISRRTPEPWMAEGGYQAEQDCGAQKENVQTLRKIGRKQHSPIEAFSLLQD
jgi:hypothetical protein